MGVGVRVCIYAELAVDGQSWAPATFSVVSDYPRSGWSAAIKASERLDEPTIRQWGSDDVSPNDRPNVELSNCPTKRGNEKKRMRSEDNLENISTDDIPTIRFLLGIAVSLTRTVFGESSTDRR